MDEELANWEELRWKTKLLSQRLFEVLDYRVRGLPPYKIADRLHCSVSKVKAANTELIDHYHIKDLSDQERDWFFFIYVRPVVDDIKQNPYILDVIRKNPDFVEAHTGPTFRLPKFIGVDPDDPKRIVHFLLFIVVCLVFGLLLFFTVLAIAAGTFTLPFIYT